MKPLLLTLLLACSLATSAFAAEPIPTIITAGLATYQENGNKAAVAVWLKGSSRENDPATISNLTGILTQVEAAYGEMIGYEPVRSVSLTPSVLRVYLLIKYEKGPLYCNFDCYRTVNGWIIPSMEFNPKLEFTLPLAVPAGGNP